MVVYHSHEQVSANNDYHHYHHHDRAHDDSSAAEGSTPHVYDMSASFTLDKGKQQQKHKDEQKQK